MPLRVLYFAAARERAGLASESIPLPQPSCTVTALLSALEARHPALAPLRPHLRVAVNQAFVGEDELVPDGAEVALIPPVAGGAGLFRVVDRPLSLDEVVSAVQGVARGGVVTFSGQVRAESRGKRVTQLHYEAYVPMAERVLAEVGEACGRQWPGTVLAIAHRVGTLVPGELAVVIAAAAPHRREAFEACAHALERLKAEAPIWKKERTEDGEVWVGLGP